MSSAEKLNLEDWDIQIGGQTVTMPISIEWDDSIKSASSTRRGKVVSTAKSEEQVKGKITMEHWEVGEIEEILRPKNQNRKGTLTGISASITGADAYGRTLNFASVTFVKGKGKIDQKAEDDKTDCDFEVEGEYEIKLHRGKK